MHFWTQRFPLSDYIVYRLESTIVVCVIHA